MQPIQHLLEAALYVDDLEKADRFYSGVLGLEKIMREDPRHVFFRIGETGVLLLFNAEETSRGDTLPAHGAKGPGHVALGIPAGSIDEWRDRLQQQSVEIETEVDWPPGGRSLYFRDPAGNSLELVTPGCWGLPSGW